MALHSQEVNEAVNGDIRSRGGLRSPGQIEISNLKRWAFGDTDTVLKVGRSGHSVRAVSLLNRAHVAGSPFAASGSAPYGRRVAAPSSKRTPGLTRALHRLISDVATRLPEFAHLEPERILVVAGEARRTSHASVRPLSQGKGRSRPTVRIDGTSIRYVITLRPLWFRASTGEQRIATLLHELFHLSGRFDGTLHRGRRHAAMGEAFSRRLKPLVKRYLAEAPPELLAPFSRHGWVLLQAWLERPPAKLPPAGGPMRRRITYTEEQLFTARIWMV